MSRRTRHASPRCRHICRYAHARRVQAVRQTVRRAREREPGNWTVKVVVPNGNCTNLYRKAIDRKRPVIRYACRRRHTPVQRVANLRARFRRNGYRCDPTLKDTASRNIRARDDGCGQRIRSPNRRKCDICIRHDIHCTSAVYLRSVVPSHERILRLVETGGRRQDDLRPRKRKDRRGNRSLSSAKGK